MLFIINNNCGGTRLMLYFYLLSTTCLLTTKTATTTTTTTATKTTKTNGTPFALNEDHSHHHQIKYSNQRHNYSHQEKQEREQDHNGSIHIHHHPHSHPHPHPHLGAFLKDYKGTSVVDFITLDKASGPSSTHSTSHPTIVLPHLPIQDYIWEGFSIQLQCNFTQPVKWIYAGQGAPLIETETHRIPTSDKSSYLFGANVVFTHTDYRQTGRYICHSIEHPHIFSDIFVYVPGEKIFVNDDSVNNDKNNNGDRDSGDGSPANKSSSDSNLSWNETEISIDADSLNEWIQLPCSVSNPNSSVQLFKDGRQIEMVRKKVFFEPMIGFELLRRGLKDPWGKYLCYETHTRQRLVVNVNPPKYVIQGDATQMVQSNKVSNYSEGENPFEASQKHSTHIKFHYDQRKDMIVCCAYDSQGRSLKRYPTLKSASCDSVHECQILKKHLSRRKCTARQPCERKRLKRHCMGHELATDMDDGGIIECSLDGEDVQEYFQYSRMNDHLFSNFDQIPPTNEILEIIVEDSKKSDKNVLACLANSFFFSHGIEWAVQHDDSDELTYLDENYSRVSIEVASGEDAVYYCFAPLWNSHEWRNTSVYVP